ncbi:hypothetical protein MAM1_0191c07671 [Mucor ambiguus]|uniref:Uncharacterized protein n=1 Tax=Mucor ambiguus TaxID=91626 RepID=A0A0C9MKV3_9FUNG|nr:hypothetical protein MAM1_0191c07671 [Mucor ambiguus]
MIKQQRNIWKREIVATPLVDTEGTVQKLAKSFHDRFGDEDAEQDLPIHTEERVRQPDVSNITKVVIIQYLEQLESHKAYIDTMESVALTVCRDLANTNLIQSMAPWKDINGPQRINMTEEAFSLIKIDHSEFKIIRNCIQLWPIQGLIKSKWIQMSIANRRKQKIGQVAVAAAAAAHNADSGAQANTDDGYA